MWSPRAQSDRLLFAKLWREKLEQTPGVDFWQDTVVGLLVKDGQVEGVRTGMGMEIRGKAVVLTNGTFPEWPDPCGHETIRWWQDGCQKPASGITEQLVELGFESGRMKTGTPPG